MYEMWLEHGVWGVEGGVIEGHRAEMRLQWSLSVRLRVSGNHGPDMVIETLATAGPWEQASIRRHLAANDS